MSGARFLGRVDGATMEVHVMPSHGEGVWVLKVGDRSEELIAPEGGVGTYFLDGRPFEVQLLREDGRARVLVNGRLLDVEVGHALDGLSGGLGAAGARGGREEIRSPMPGLVVKIPLGVGAEVEAGQTVAVVEAMKMQNELQASLGGVVREIRVQDGDTVDSGAVLLVVESHDGSGE
jgi:acetyl/propionyl-CoA carboxylase alpha subunit